MAAEKPPINPYAMPGTPGAPEGGPGLPPRPLWETVLILACGLSLIPFFLPVSIVGEPFRFVIGSVAAVVLVWIVWRRLRALRGTLTTRETTPTPGGPKPYHVPRKFGDRKP